MKKNLTYSLIALAAVSICAVSCINSEWGNRATAGTTVKVDKESTVSAESFFQLKDNKFIKTDNDGEFVVDVPAKTPIEETPTFSGDVGSIKGQIVIDGAGVPPIASTESGGAFEEPAIVITVTNPSPDKIKFKGEVSIKGASNIALPDCIIDGNKTVDIVYTADITDPDIKGDLYVAIPAPLANAIAKMPESITITDMSVSSATKAPIQTAAFGLMRLNGAYRARMHMAPNTTYKIHQTFRNLGFDLDDYIDYEATQYKVNLDVTNRMPIEFTMDIDSEGYKASLDNPVKAGSVADPVSSHVVMSVKAPKAPVSRLNDMDIVVTATANKRCAFGDLHKVTIHMESLKVDVIK